MRGHGNVYKRKGTKYWWIRWSVRGKPQYESSGSVVRADAVKLLAHRVADKDMLLGLRPASLVAVLDDYIQDAKLRALRAINVLERNCRAALEFFGLNANVLDVTSRRLREYQAALAEGGLGNATINGRMTILHSALKLAASNEYIRTPPAFPHTLKKPPPRQGFLEHEDYLAISAELPDWGQGIFEFAYTTGWRRNEILWLPWDEVDWDARMIHLGRERSKNGRGRPRPISSDLEPLMLRRRAARIVGLPYVFHRGRKKIGITGWRNTFVKARKAAGRPDVLPHDCRRTAVRNLLRCGVPEKVAMELIGHRTRDMIDRYNITSEADIIDAAERFAKRTRK